MCLAVQSTSSIVGEYEAVLGLGQPTVQGTYDDGSIDLDYDSFAMSYVMQLYFQSPNYEPTVCFDYAWNCTDYSNSYCTATSNVYFGTNTACSTYDSSKEVTVTSNSDSSWELKMDTYKFGSYSDEAERKATIASA